MARRFDGRGFDEEETTEQDPLGEDGFAAEGFDDAPDGGPRFGDAESEDALRIDVPARTTDQTYEAFTIDFEQTGSGTDLVLMWDRTRLAVPLRPSS